MAFKIIEKLSLKEDIRFTKCNEIVSKTREQFIECGTALAEIRDNRYYRKHFDTFDEYLENMAGFSRQYASMVINGAAAHKALPKDLSTKVDNVATAAAIAKVPAENRVAVVKHAAQSGKLTAKSIQAAAVVVAVTKEEPKDILDGVGYVIPTHLVPLWNRQTEVRELLQQMSDIKAAFKEGIDKDDPLYRELTEHFLVQCSNIRNVMKEALPFAVCPACNGRNEDKCRLCKGRGLVSQFKYNGPSVTQEQRDFRTKLAKK